MRSSRGNKGSGGGRGWSSPCAIVSVDSRSLRVNNPLGILFSLLVIFLSRPLGSPHTPLKTVLMMSLRDWVSFLSLSLGRLVKKASSSRDSLVEVISSMESSGLLVSGAVVVRRTRGHSFLGMSSSGDAGRLLVLEATEALADKAGRRTVSEPPLVSIVLKGEDKPLRFVMANLLFPKWRAGDLQRFAANSGPGGLGFDSRMLNYGRTPCHENRFLDADEGLLPASRLRRITSPASSAPVRERWRSLVAGSAGVVRTSTGITARRCVGSHSRQKSSSQAADPSCIAMALFVNPGTPHSTNTIKLQPYISGPTALTM